MMKNLLRTIVFFVCVSAMSGLQAQKFKGFSGNSDTYIDELTEMVASDVNLKGDQKKDYEALLTEYGQVWSNYLSANTDRTFTAEGRRVRIVVAPNGGHSQIVIYN